VLAITNATIYTPSDSHADTAVLIQNGRITKLCPTADLAIPTNAQLIDAAGHLLVPGYIDLQLNGAFGHDFTADPQTIWPVSAKLPRYGVTAYLPTIITSPLENIKRARQVLLEQRPSAYRGAEPLGLHIEGPFLNPRKKGAHNPAYLQAPDTAHLAGWSPAGGVRLVTLAPELPGAIPVIETLAASGVVVSAGHSMATYDEAMAGIAAGMRYGTHLFNAMSSIGHRQPGLPGALLSSPDCVTGLIPDGIHVHPALIKLIWSAKGSAGLNLVSDAMGALGMPPGKYILKDFEVTVTDKDSRLADGTLAGSVLPIDQALRKLISYTGCSLPEALATITTTPAKLLNIDDQRGQIAPGLIADLLLLTPDLQVATTIAAGDIVYEQT
jgi:N-acetylglucosamine-6-phosphate deacetylase